MCDIIAGKTNKLTDSTNTYEIRNSSDKIEVVVNRKAGIYTNGDEEMKRFKYLEANLSKDGTPAPG